MRIKNLRPIHGRSANLARFDVELGEDVLICGVSLRLAGGGSYYVLPAKHAGLKTAHFHPRLARQITEAALAEYRSGASVN